ncbi:hypothetical protein HB770_04100 [Rhizobium leguminosarum bv. viciae]|uniref:Uncharacterized protein n=1 Tax=Rhizobium leguminosarum bv. viciae TaxID=387 RepID=A0A7G6RHU6_RHILV|nr:hypothetical protein HB770_04100 [Rhizobium leguminosarum bv. viciae]
MPSKAFLKMANRAIRHFRDDTGVHRWFRHDGRPEGDVVQVIFNAAYAEIDVTGIKVSDEQPTLWIKLSDVLAIAPEREQDLDRAVDNDDTFEIAYRPYRAESCRSDGYGLLEVKLFRDRR